MYLRSTKRKNKDGSVVEYYQLAHNERHPVTRKPVAKIIHSFGRADELDLDQLVRLCNSIARVCGLHVIDPLTDNESTNENDPLSWPRDLKLVRTRPLGTVLTIETLWERLGIGKTLRDICKKRKLKVAYDKALLAMCANRLCEPESKLGVWDRWLDKVYLPSCEGLKLEQMYEAMDLLYEHATEVEHNIFFNTANLFNLKVDLIFYDTTTAGFSIDQEDDEQSDDNLRRYGRAKDGQWSPQVVVALAVTREGFSVRCWVLPGNTADSTTIETVRKERIRIDRGKIREAAKYDGKWVLETNDDTISVEDAACGYKGLMIIERCFRSLKRTQIKLSPMYHWLSRRIEAHVRICVLALLIERVAEVACDASWSRIRHQLEKMQATEFFSIKCRFFRRNEITAGTRSIFKKLKISIPKKILSIEKHA